MNPKKVIKKEDSRHEGHISLEVQCSVFLNLSSHAVPLKDKHLISRQIS
jgi:hypothetical protein